MSELIRGLQPGQRIRITQRVRVGSTATWTATVEGVYRGVNYLNTGLATDRVPEDDIVVVAVHFTKDNGELSSVTLDEWSKIEVMGVRGCGSCPGGRGRRAPRLAKARSRSGSPSFSMLQQKADSRESVSLAASSIP